MLQLFGRVLFELARDVHVRRPLEDLRIDDVGDDGLILPRQIFIQQINEFFS